MEVHPDSPCSSVVGLLVIHGNFLSTGWIQGGIHHLFCVIQWSRGRHLEPPTPTFNHLQNFHSAKPEETLISCEKPCENLPSGLGFQQLRSSEEAAGRGMGLGVERGHVFSSAFPGVFDQEREPEPRSGGHDRRHHERGLRVLPLLSLLAVALRCLPK